MKHSHQGACRHKPAQPSKYRLPRTVVPRSYVLTIDSDPDRADFNGQVDIAVDVLSPVSAITLNALDLELDNIVLQREDGTSFTGQATYDKQTEMATLAFNGIVGSGSWKLSIDFKGLVGSQSTGLFLSGEGDKKILCTQLEAAEARRVFPCFDEPDFKATFQINLILDRYYMALANGQGVCSMAMEGNRKLVKFAETVPMSSYLVCFTLGPIVSSDPVHVNGKELRIWSLPGNEDKTSFALGVAAFGLDYFERYFGIPYPNGDKIDLVAIPDFAWGGMENVGLIICGEYVLLVDEKSDAHYKQSQARIIMHELAHQWFGDYVTMAWWNGLWLNESFATFMASKACQAWNEGGDIDEWELFCAGREKAYQADCLKNTHPIEETVENARDAIMLVDAISYEKGCSVLYQFEQFIGEEIFRKGISTYLKRHAFCNTEASDLWDSLEQVCHEEKLTLPVREVLDTWIKQSGHPEVLVSRLGRGRKGGTASGTIVIKQRPFRLLPSGRNSRKLWPIPVTLAYEHEGKIHERKLLVDKRHTTVDLAPGFSWVKVNAGGSGFYRVRYSKDLNAALLSAINKMTPVEQHNYLADAAAFVDAGILSGSEFFELLQSSVQTAHEPDFRSFGTHLCGLYSLLDQVSRSRFRKRLAQTLREHVDKHKLQVSGDGASALPFTAYWRPYNLNLSPLIQKESLSIVKAWQADPASVSDWDLSMAAMVLGFARVRLPRGFSENRQLLRDATPAQLQGYLVRLAERASKSPSPRRKLDAFDLFAAAMLDHSVRSAHYPSEEVLSNWTAWLEEGLAPMSITHRLRALRAVDSAEEEAKLIELFKQHPYAPLRKEVAKAMEKVRANVLLRQRESEVLSRYFKKRSGTRKGPRAA
ncbi:MAG: M1 family metallopeptidase [Cyanobacteria bacterium SZAS LIN-3]|nr:M1 family metallopeptidase [Cyanobacteria bacterium SZAS LIN-3]